MSQEYCILNLLNIEDKNIKVDNLIITEIRLYNFMNEDGKLFYDQYII